MEEFEREEACNCIKACCFASCDCCICCICTLHAVEYAVNSEKATEILELCHSPSRCNDVSRDCLYHRRNTDHVVNCENAWADKIFYLCSYLLAGGIAVKSASDFHKNCKWIVDYFFQDSTKEN